MRLMAFEKRGGKRRCSGDLLTGTSLLEEVEAKGLTWSF